MKTVFWFRRDLRLHDNHGLFQALANSSEVLPVFVFDKNILDKLEDSSDQRVTFIHQCLETLQKQLTAWGSTLSILVGDPTEEIPKFLAKQKAEAIYLNHDYESYAIERDKKIASFCSQNNIQFNSYKDQVIFEKKEVCKKDGTAYTVFTPYSKVWKAQLEKVPYYPSEHENYHQNYVKCEAKEIPTLASFGFEKSKKSIPSAEINTDIIKSYDKTRDFPAFKGTSRLSVHLRFGTISIRECVSIALETNETWLNELIWRDFYMMILHNFPHVAEKSFKKDYENIPWDNNKDNFKKWCEGKTGYPMVDAGMRELNATGFMHNRVRMITASFLIKHLLIDWKWGEQYFAEKLLDYDLSANNGGWQWAASSGCDAVPYFRIFNPTLQTEKFDKELKYIKKWIPEFDNPFEYPQPIIKHSFARQRAIDTYKNALQK